MTEVGRIAGLKVSRRIKSERLPDLAPPEERLGRARSEIFSSDMLALGQDVVEPETAGRNEDLPVRIAVHLMSFIVMIFMAPLGMALLLLNIMRGESFRVTAYGMALMGMLMAVGHVSGLS